VSENEEDEKREKVFVVIWLREEWWKKNAKDEIEREEDRKFGKALNEG